MLIELGKIYRDTITGFEGVALERIERFNSTPKVCIQPTGLNDGKIPESQWIDEWRVEEKNGASQKVGF